MKRRMMMKGLELSPLTIDVAKAQDQMEIELQSSLPLASQDSIVLAQEPDDTGLSIAEAHKQFVNISLDQNKHQAAALPLIAKDCTEQRIELSQITDYLYISSNIIMCCLN